MLEKLKETILEIQQYDLYSMEFGNALFSVTLEFILGDNEDSLVNISLVGVRLFKVSRWVDDEILPFFAGSIECEHMLKKSQIISILESLGQEANDNSQELENAFYFKSRGEIDLDIICKEINISHPNLQ